jgi:hypothetical protein
MLPILKRIAVARTALSQSDHSWREARMELVRSLKEIGVDLDLEIRHHPLIHCPGRLT